MKESDITKETIAKAKEIAKYFRKEIKYGDWFLNEGGFAKVWPYRHNCKRIDVIPILSISDCLERLKEMKLRYIFHEHELGKVCVSIISDDMLAVSVDNLEHPTLHLALLSALLEVLKKEHK